ncbi:hypothetical protein CANINC_002907 [Pichia inconspicua]|uniref:Protein YIF1 n=1 Tax=Pichia inconspicua TaxID=52247 RepID=A0A4T0X007_9ASCO|nr:hypothetical protein CANINC_002907 [[Candida] inconspicua]
MYNPYQSQVNNQQGNIYNQDSNVGVDPLSNNINQHQQQQHQQQQQQYQQHQSNQFNLHNLQSQQPLNVPSVPLNNFFNDPTAQMGLQFSQTAFNASQQYMQQNIGQIVSNQDIKYYFKVSNSYVLKKLLLILFPFRNKSWVRQLKNDTPSNGSTDVYLTPLEDVNAPDLYIPTMAFLSYIIAWALDEGMKGDFHPELLGYATTRTLAFYIMDVIMLKVSFYVLGIESRNSKMWDLVSYTGYKFVPVLFMLLFSIISPSSTILKYMFLTGLVFSYGFFLMRSLRYVVLPGGVTGPGVGGKLRLQFLFTYCILVQGLFIWLMI